MLPSVKVECELIAPAIKRHHENLKNVKESNSSPRNIAIALKLDGEHMYRTPSPMRRTMATVITYNIR
jgi:hypothetical protein